jgi:hypothetical protein
MTVPGTTVATVSIDPFSDSFLTDPYPQHEILRETAAVVWIETHAVFGVARYEQVHGALNDWRTFCSSAGVGLSDFRRETPWRPPSLLLESDPPAHTQMRGIITTVLSRRALNELRESFTTVAEQLVETLIERGRFDAIEDLAKAFPLSVFPEAVGIVDPQRQFFLPYGNMAFNAFGPRNALFERSMKAAAPLSEWIMAHCQRNALRPGGFGARIYEAADRGEITDTDAALLIRSLLTAGMDTTVNAIGNAMVAFTRYPEAWRILHETPDLARSAMDEVIRFESPVQTFFRTTTRAVEVGGVTIPAGQKLLMFLGAANRDPRRWQDPDQFDIRRNTTGHVGFGAGIHACVGQMIARLEGEVVLKALARKVKRIDAVSAPVPRLNNTLRGWDSLGVSVEPA